MTPMKAYRACHWHFTSGGFDLTRIKVSGHVALLYVFKFTNAPNILGVLMVCEVEVVINLFRKTVTFVLSFIYDLYKMMPPSAWYVCHESDYCTLVNFYNNLQITWKTTVNSNIYSLQVSCHRRFVFALEMLHIHQTDISTLVRWIHFC